MTVEVTSEQRMDQLCEQVSRFAFLEETHASRVKDLAATRPFSPGADASFYRVKSMLEARAGLDQALQELARVTGKTEILEIYAEHEKIRTETK